MMRLPQNIFPCNALPPFFMAAVNDLANNVQVPHVMAFSSLLGAASLACQDKILVELPNGRTAPCNLFICTIAESGTGKSATDRHVISVIQEFEAQQRVIAKPLLDRYLAEHTQWTEELKGVKRSIRTKAQKGHDSTVEFMALDALIANEPEAPQVPKMILGDATPEAVLRSLATQWPSAGLMSDEAGVLFDSRAMSKQASLNKLWDGDRISKDTVTADNYALLLAQLTVAIQVQPKTFDSFLIKQGRHARDNGFLARTLFSRPQSLQGFRCFDGRPNTWNGLTPFRTRLKEILDMHTVESHPVQRETLHFSPEAMESWLSFSSRVESDQREGGYLADVRDAASKMPEILARVAAIFHYVEGRKGAIQADTIEQARQICGYFLEEFKRLFGDAPEIPIELLDADLLEKWLVKFCQRYPGTTSIRKNDIAHLGPNQLRGSKIRRDAACYVLHCQGKISPQMQGKTQWFYLNPGYFPVPYASPQASYAG